MEGAPPSGPEAVAPPPPPEPEKKPYAGWGYRVGAYLTDAGIALCAAILAAILFAGDDESTQRTVVGLVAIGVWILVTSVAMAIFDGQTVGKRIAGIRVVIQDRPVGFGFSLLRDQVLRVLYLVPLFFLVDSIWAAADGQRQTLRDKMVGTHVVRAGANATRGVVIGVLATVLIVGWIALSVALDPESGSGGGSTRDGYSDLDRQVFVDSCTDEGADESYCTCLFDYIADRVPYDDFAGVESENTDTWPRNLRDTMADGIQRCS